MPAQPFRRAARALLAALALPVARADDAVVVLNEVMFHPPAASEPAEAALEWIELRSLMAVDVDVSGWSLTGGVTYVFPAGTVITGGTHRVVAANPAAVGLPDALGPWTGKLSNRGETLRLRNRNGRVMDELEYGTDGKWPSGPDGGGTTLARRAAPLASGTAAWRESLRLGGTPGGENFSATLPPVTTVAVPLDATWRAWTTGTDPGAAWRDVAFDDSAWMASPAGFQLGADPLPSGVTAQTPLPAGPATFHFRRSFVWNGLLTNTTARLRLCVDDGAAAYLNGVEITRFNLPAGALAPSTLALLPQRNPPTLREFAVPAGLLVAGTNVVAVEVHQAPGLSQGSALITYTPGPSPVSARADGPYTIGARIRVGAAPRQLTHLGVQDADAADANDPDGADGLTGYADDDGFYNGAAGLQVGLWDTAGTLLASATVVSADPQYLGWRYKPVTPVTLAANTEYFIGARVGSALEWFLDSASGTPPFAAEPGFTWVFNAFATGAALARPASNGTLTLGRWGAANALFDAPVPLVVGPDATDAVFAASLFVTENAPRPPELPLRLNEITTEFVELHLGGTHAVDLSGFTLRQVTPAETLNLPLPSTNLLAGARLALPVASAPGDRLLLLAADGMTVLDSAEVKATPRARLPEGSGPWLRPAASSPGAANALTLRDELVINEMYHDLPAPALFDPGVPRPGAWIELHNHSAAPVDAGGWRLDDAVSFTFPSNTVIAAGGFLLVAENPAAVLAAYAPPPAAPVLGPWSGRLSGSHETIRLEDANGNPVDEVAYFDSGRWPRAADGGGSSLELRDPLADNQSGEAWAASDESARAAWQTFTWSGPNTASQLGEPTLWRELNLLLVDGPGECLVDDVRVTDLTTSANLIQNGDFSAGSAHWRFLGNHRGSTVEPEPGNPGNTVLRLRASGPGEYQGNQIESTFLGNQALVEGRNYEISLRARWLSGGGRLNTRLYFNRLPRTHRLAVTPAGGTPGAANSRRVANLGPTFEGLSHAPAMPAPGEPVAVRVLARDPQGVAALTLRYAVAGGAWQSVAMTAAGGDTWSGAIPGQSSGVVQFYLEAADAAGAVSFFPAGGPDSRALIPVRDGQATGALPTVRLVLTAADASFLHTAVNTLSNEERGCTVILDEREAVYDAGVRLKGSFVGRNVQRVGFHLRFPPDRPFRGVHEVVSVDRSQHATVGAVGEIVVKHIAAAAGGIPDMHDDLARFIHTLPAYTGMSQLRMSGFGPQWLDDQYPSGSEGTQVEMEVHRWNLATVDGNPESPKLPGTESGGTGFNNLNIADYGANPEAYRWQFLQTGRRAADDYTTLVPFARMFSLTGTAFADEARARLDFDACLRTLAFMSLVGPTDAIFTGTNHHNIRYYIRPHDGRALIFPWDWDSAWQRATNAPLVGGDNLAKIITTSPDAARRYQAQLCDLIEGPFNSAYMQRWTAHYGALSGQDMTGILNHIGARATFVLGQLPTTTAFTAVAGTPDSNGAVVLTGTANIRVRTVRVNGIAYTPTWTGPTTWSLTVPLAAGSNTLTLTGLGKTGEPVAGATTGLTVDNPNAPGWAALRINEWLAENDGADTDPADGRADDWFELHNPTGQPVGLAGWHLSDAPATPALFTVPAGWVIPAGGFLRVWADNEPAQNPAVPAPSDGLHVNFKLAAGGETLLLSAPDLREIDRVTFGPQSADDAEGRYPDAAESIVALSLPTPAAPNLHAWLLPIGTDQLRLTTTPGWRYQVETSIDLHTWLPWTPPATAGGATLDIPAAHPESRRYFRAAVGEGL